MERLVFNFAKHKLKELEKYGFDKNVCVYVYGDSDSSYICVDDEVCLQTSIDFAGCDIDDDVLCKLYDLIKDGLVVKEKK